MKDKIISCEWESGKHLSSNQITQELGMSRTPIEKALLLLEAQGLIESQDGKFVVCTQSLEDIIEIYQLKEAIETQAVLIILANGGLKPDQIELLKRAVEDHTHAADVADDQTYFQSGMEFHALLLHFAGNSRLIKVHEQLQLQNERAQWLNTLMPDQEGSIEEHNKLVNALERRDAAAAVCAVQEHSHNTINRYTQILTSPLFRRAIIEVSNIIKNAE